MAFVVESLMFLIRMLVLCENSILSAALLLFGIWSAPVFFLFKYLFNPVQFHAHRDSPNATTNATLKCVRVAPPADPVAPLVGPSLWSRRFRIPFSNYYEDSAKFEICEIKLASIHMFLNAEAWINKNVDGERKSLFPFGHWKGKPFVNCFFVCWTFVVCIPIVCVWMRTRFC